VYEHDEDAVTIGVYDDHAASAVTDELDVCCMVGEA
jgi:hypothetical protein